VNFQPADTRTAARMTELPTDTEQLADLLLNPVTDYASLVARLADQVGARPSRRLLAAAHGIAADRLWNEA
jgi:hypothetical protein